MNLSKLHCLIDLSGSMSEYGKPMLVINLLRYIRQFADQNDKDIKYFTWQTDINEISWPMAEDVTLPNSEGSGNVEMFCRWCEINSDARILVLTDGYFKLNKEQRHQLSNFGHLFLIGVGGDANFPLLSVLSNHCYGAEQLDHVLHIIWRANLSDIAPLSRVDLTQFLVESKSKDEDDDEW